MLAVEAIKSAIRFTPIDGAEDKGDAIAFGIATPDLKAVGEVEVVLKQLIVHHSGYVN